MLNKFINFLLLLFIPIYTSSCIIKYQQKNIVENINTAKISNKCEYEEIDGEKYEPLNQSLENPRLEQPYDLAVSNDGNTVYVTD